MSRLRHDDRVGRKKFMFLAVFYAAADVSIFVSTLFHKFVKFAVKKKFYNFNDYVQKM